MVKIDYQSDKYVYLMLATNLGLPRNSSVKPFSMREFNILVREIAKLNLRPGVLLEKNRDDIKKIFGNNEQVAAKIEELLSRREKIAFELADLEEKGIRVVSRAERETYPKKLFTRLKQAAPPIIFYSGDLSILSNKSIAVVGSRKAEDNFLNIAREIGEKCAWSGITLISGGANGVDYESMVAALNNKGFAVAFVAKPMISFLKKTEISSWIREGRLILLSTVLPNGSFTIAKAMERNKYVYALADFSIVVRSGCKGGTWSGATEALRKNFTNRVFVIDTDEEKLGNKQLIAKGGIPIKVHEITETNNIFEFLERKGLNIVDKQVVKPKDTTNDVYYLILNKMIELLNQPMSEKEFASILNVQIGQARNWLKRLVKEGYIVKKKGIYQSKKTKRLSNQVTLFERDI